MAEAGGEKTEKPTSKRLRDARGRGQVAKSMDLNSAIVLTGAFILIGMAGPYTFQSIYGIMGTMLSGIHTKPIDQTAFLSIFSSLLQTIALLVLPFFLTTMLVGVLMNVIQVKPLFTLEPLKPKLDKINPINGFKRLFSVRSTVEVAKALIKMSIIGACGYGVVHSHWQELLLINQQTAYGALAFVVSVIREAGVWICILLFAIGLLDWWYQLYEYQKQLRMTKYEVKKERKEEELDPTLKGRMRQMGAKILAKRQLAAVPTADVVVTNPTHFAVAIQYDPDIAPAPRVVAKGQDHFALKIKAVAKENKVPVIENKPLARSLYAAVELDRMIPPELFVAVAEVLALVYSKNKGRKIRRQKGGKPPVGRLKQTVYQEQEEGDNA